MTHLVHNTLRKARRRSLRLGADSVSESGSEVLDVEVLLRDRLRSSARLVDHVAPELLVAKERDDHGRATLRKSYGGRTGTAVMDDSGYALLSEEPVVRDVAQEEDVRRNVDVSEIALDDGVQLYTD